MENLESHYLIVSSDEAKKHSSSNVSSNFYTTLKTPLKLESNVYEIGVAELYFKPCCRLFGYEHNDNLVVVEENKGNYFREIFVKIKKIWYDVSDFNKFNQEKGIKISILQYTLAGVLHYALEHEYKEEREFRLSDKFMEIFGFEKNSYRKKLIIAEKPYDGAAYARMKIGETAFFELVLPPKSTNLYLREPSEVSVAGLVNELAEQLIQHHITEITFSANEHEDGSDEIDLDGDIDFSVTFSKRLSSMLGIEGFIRPKYKMTNIDFFRGNKRIIIFSPIVQPQLLFDSAEPVLRFLNHPREQKNAVLSFNPIIYNPVHKTMMDVINLKLMNESRQPIPFEGDFTTVLHLRPKRI